MNFYPVKIIALALLFSIVSCKADDSPGFFLKITKNVPRLGRRSDKDFESSFLKNYKVIPRIGRSAENEYSTHESWLNEPPNLMNLKKRVLMNPSGLSAPEHELSVVQPVNSNTLIELLDKDAISSDNVKFVHWKDFDRALQLDMDLYGKVFSLGRRPDQRLKQDLSMGSYIPLFSRGPVDEDGTDFMLYSRANDFEKTLNSDNLRYNRI